MEMGTRKMLDAILTALFLKKDRRVAIAPVQVERRKMTHKLSQERLSSSIERLQQTVTRKCEDLKK